MTKELVNVINEYAIDLNYEGIEVSATVEVTACSYDNGEVDVRVISIDSEDENWDIGGTLYGDIEEYIIQNWDDFKEIPEGEGGGGMKLLTKEILNKFEKQGRCDTKKPEDVKIIVKFFNPTGIGTWYATEWYPEDGVFFGFVSLFNDHCDELGYFSLAELQEFKGAFGLGIERDKYFGDYTLKDVMDGARP